MTYDVIVIGLGAMGSATCFQLAKRGMKVAGFDQFQLGHAMGSSHGQSRIIRKAYFEHPDYVPLLTRSYELWRELIQESKTQLYHQTGIVYSCDPAGALLRGLKQSSKAFDIPLEPLDHRDVSTWFLDLGDREVVREPEAGYLEVENSVAAFQRLAKDFGAHLFDGDGIKNWAAHRGGVEVSTQTTTYKAAKLVITAGPWAFEILKNSNLPLKLLKKSMYWLEAEESVFQSNGMPCFLHESDKGIFYGFPMRTKVEGIKIAEHTGGQPIDRPSAIDTDYPSEEGRVLGYARRHMRGVSAKVITQQPCIYTMTPDEHFIVDAHHSHSNVFYAAGFSGHGFKFAPVIGEVLADLAFGGTTSKPISFLKRRN